MEKLPHTFAPGRMCCIIFRSAGCASLQAYFFYFSFPYLSALLNFFSAEMLDRNFVNLYGSSRLGNFSFYQNIIRVILFCNLSHQIYCPVSVFENPASSEYYHTL